MSATSDQPSGHTYLDFNAPLSDARADRLIADLQPLRDREVVDLGCGWAELLLRLVAAEPTARGVGIDDDVEAIARGQANAAARGLTDRVSVRTGDVTGWSGSADILLSVGASHAWGGTDKTLRAARSRLRPGGRFLLGDGIWERPPTPEALRALETEPAEFRSLGGLVDLAIEHGFRPLSISAACMDEWDDFESRWCAGRERWLLEYPDAPNAAEVRTVVDEHRTGWLHGYRGVLGFAYLVLGLPA